MFSTFCASLGKARGGSPTLNESSFSTSTEPEGITSLSRLRKTNPLFPSNRGVYAGFSAPREPFKSRKLLVTYRNGNTRRPVRCTTESHLQNQELIAVMAPVTPTKFDLSASTASLKSHLHRTSNSWPRSFRTDTLSSSVFSFIGARRHAAQWNKLYRGKVSEKH